MSKIKTVEQKRSEFALKCVKNVLSEAVSEEGEEKLPGNYKSLVKKFPMMVLKNGLLQTIAFVEAKSRNNCQHNILLEHLRDYLNFWSPLGIKLGNKRLSEYLSSDTHTSQYRNITTDLLTFTKWLGRYAEALIEQEGESG